MMLRSLKQQKESLDNHGYGMSSGKIYLWHYLIFIKELEKKNCQSFFGTEDTILYRSLL